MSESEENKAVPQDGGESTEKMEEKGSTMTSASSPQPEEKTSEEGPTPKQNGEEERTVDAPPQPTPSPVAAVPSPGVSLRTDWYQTQSDVYLDLMVKSLRREDVEVQFSERTVKLHIKLPSGDDYTREFRLSHPIAPSKSTYKVLRTKVELKIRKTAADQWASLEKGSGPTPKLKQPQVTAATGNDTVHKYPSSSHYTRDWDKVVANVKKEEKDEKVEGDAALNKLFQQIYGDGSDEVRRAMNKSFVESGGTVLSTNWKEVGEKTVERKPPDGMEWKKYDT